MGVTEERPTNEFHVRQFSLLASSGVLFTSFLVTFSLAVIQTLRLFFVFPQLSFSFSGTNNLHTKFHDVLELKFILF